MNILAAAFCHHEVPAYHHVVAFRHILVKDGIILYSFRQEIISSGDKRIVSIYKPNIHNDRGRFLANLLYAYIQMTAFLGHKVAAYCHPVTFRYILLKYGIVLDSFRYSVVSSSYDFVSVLELDIHGYIRADFLDTYY